ncbi:hypothetical protein MMC14_000530 [Varicellaria rhodocarpa]|nr:hypothetical protein [Varicellaria rhodocarpa]
MSSFISSFIVDPVIRQARRFSRSSTPSDFAPTEDPSCDGDRISNLVGARNMAAQEEVRLRLDISSEYGGPSSNIISDHPVVLSPTSEDDGLEDDLRSSHQHNQLITDHSDNNSNPEQSTLQLGRQRSGPRMEENTYNGPLQRIVERSNTSHSNSIYSTTDSDMTPVEDSVLLRRHTSQEGSRGGSGTYNGKMGSGPLPADDGMGVVRKRIIEIQRSGVSTKEKSRLIHDLMTREYNSSQANLRSLERPFTPENSHQPEEWTHVSPSTSLSSNSAETVDFWYVSPEDLKPSYYTPPSHPKASQDVNAMDQDECLQDEAKTLGCTHYMRNVKLQCSVCFRWYTCRFCHDAAEDHPLNRRETKNMLCMLCGCAQRAAGECRACGESAAWYYCGVCKLWDNDPEKNIYHCDDCGICRIGQGLGKDFYHCKVCAPWLSNAQSLKY